MREGLVFGKLGVEVVAVGDQRRELASLVETRSKEPRDLLDQGV